MSPGGLGGPLVATIGISAGLLFLPFLLLSLSLFFLPGSSLISMSVWARYGGVLPVSRYRIRFRVGDPYSRVSCRNPWGWREQRPFHQHSKLKCGNNYLWHPLRHSALLTIGTVVAETGSYSIPSTLRTKCGNNYLWHPLRHSALVTIGTVVAETGSYSPEHKIFLESI